MSRTGVPALKATGTVTNCYNISEFYRFFFVVGFLRQNAPLSKNTYRIHYTMIE